ELIQSCNHGLIFSRRTERFLQTDRAACEHASSRHLGIAVAEYGVARQHDLPHSLSESRGPAQWSLRMTIDKVIDDAFRLHKKIGDNAAEEVIRRTDAKTCCFVQQQGVVRHEENRTGIVMFRIIGPPNL